jgi:hypothetical protein
MRRWHRHAGHVRHLQHVTAAALQALQLVRQVTPLGLLCRNAASMYVMLLSLLPV